MILREGRGGRPQGGPADAIAAAGRKSAGARIRDREPTGERNRSAPRFSGGTPEQGLVMAAPLPLLGYASLPDLAGG